MDVQNFESIHEILKSYWGYDQFRPLQEDIISSVLAGHDTLALLPTGGGKSICFQVPALAQEGVCLVVSPLIALMKDQVQNLKKKRIKAEAIYSGQSSAEVSRIIDNALFDKEFKFLYVSPERLKSDLFRINLKRMKLCLVAIDEAHCISQWGYDFRPPYLCIAEIREFFPTVPFLALTATATPAVVKDIQHQLKFKKENVFQKSFKRDNLTYCVVKEEDKYGRMLRIIEKYKGTGIVYVRNRRKTKEIAHFLQQKGIAADFYHAGEDAATRDKKQMAWMTGQTRIIVSTNAFGMGIDKPDVRFVIHADTPDTLEGYFQEAGRGGRDLQPAIAVMLYDATDLQNLDSSFQSAFPPLDFIKQVYRELCNYLRIAIGCGMECAFPFDLFDFAQHYQHHSVETYHALKCMEQSGAITLTDEVFTPSKLCLPFTATDFKLIQNSPTYKQYEAFMQMILRSYGGLFNHFVSINEREMAARLECTTAEVVATLEKLQQAHLVQYKKQCTTPYIIFNYNRVHERNLFSNPTAFLRRKQVANDRLKAVKQYVTSTNICRSQQLLAYFGEKESPPCGSCDVCIRAKRRSVDKLLFQQLSEEIRTAYKQCGGDIKQLVAHFATRYTEEQIVKVTRWLIDNDKL